MELEFKPRTQTPLRVARCSCGGLQHTAPQGPRSAAQPRWPSFPSSDPEAPEHYLGDLLACIPLTLAFQIFST